MIAVLIVACSLALLKKWPECLLVVVLLGIPLAGLSGLLGKVPPRRTSWRFGISAVMLGLIILGAGWFWGRSVLWFFERQEGLTAVPGTSRSRHAELLGVTIPAIVTAFGLILNLLALADTCVTRRRFGLLLLVAIYALMLTIAWCILFGVLNAEAFRNFLTTD
jgi:hypothetical protein